MAKLKQSEKALQLGKTLVQQFSEHGRIDLTSAWMAQYLAELIGECETETSPTRKRQLQQSCAETILELWKKRKYYPGSIRPLEGVADVIPVLKALQDPDDDDIFSWRSFRAAEDDTAWGHFMAKARTNTEAIIKLSILAQLTDVSFQSEKKWTEHFDLLSEIEKEFGKYLDSLVRSPAYEEIEVTIEFTEPGKKIKKKKEKLEPPKDRVTLILEKIDSLLTKQMEAFNQLRKINESKKKG